MASYVVSERAVARARRLIRSRQYVLNSDWGDVQPKATDENAFLGSHSWEEYAEWHLGLTEGAPDETKARYAFVYGDFRRWATALSRTTLSSSVAWIKGPVHQRFARPLEPAPMDELGRRSVAPLSPPSETAI